MAAEARIAINLELSDTSRLNSEFSRSQMMNLTVNQRLIRSRVQVSQGDADRNQFGAPPDSLSYCQFGGFRTSE